MREEAQIRVQLTLEEAWEILSRCMNSVEPDNEASDAALRKIAQATQAPLLFAHQVHMRKAA